MALTREQAQAKVREILDLAKNEKKALTYQEVMNKLSELDIDADAIDAVFETLESEGINVINAPEDEAGAVVPELTGTDMDLSVPEGISIDDPVRMYLKEIQSNIWQNSHNLNLSKSKMLLPTKYHTAVLVT